MEWKNNKCGDTRIITKFLFLPLQLGDKTKWLETATIKQKWNNWAEEGWKWHNCEWVDFK